MSRHANFMKLRFKDLNYVDREFKVILMGELLKSELNVLLFNKEAVRDLAFRVGKQFGALEQFAPNRSSRLCFRVIEGPEAGNLLITNAIRNIVIDKEFDVCTAIDVADKELTIKAT